VNEVTIRPDMTLQEYYAYQNALRYGRCGPIVYWGVLAAGAACLASSAVLTWATPASVLAGLALAALIFILLLSGQFDTRRRRQAYERYRESNANYTFTNDRILGTSRYGESSLSWAAVDRVMETRTAYLLIVRSSCICVPKRDIPPDKLGDFIQLLTTHHLFGQTAVD